jgi:hypothetical protein
MKAEKVHLLALKPDEKPLEFINPSKRAFSDKAFFVDSGVKMALAPALGPFTIAFVFGNIGSNTTVPQEFARIFGVKGTVSIKEGVSIRKFQVVKLAKQIFETVNEGVTIIMIASNHLAGRKNVAIGIRQRDDIAGLCLFSALIGDRFAPFFAALWLPSRLRIAKFSSYLILRIPAANRRSKLPSLLHL